MKLLNFSIGDDFISVVKDDTYFDLHNDFDFISYNYNVPDKELQLIFRRGNGVWVQNKKIDNLIFKCTGVSFLKIKDGNAIEYPDDESCLDGIGFATSDIRNDMDSILASNEFHDNYDMIFTFVTGQAIKIHCKEILLETN